MRAFWIRLSLPIMAVVCCTVGLIVWIVSGYDMATPIGDFYKEEGIL